LEVDENGNAIVDVDDDDDDSTEVIYADTLCEPEICCKCWRCYWHFMPGIREVIPFH